MRLLQLRLCLLLIAPTMVVLSGCGTTQTNLVTGEAQRGAYSWEEEVQIGSQADQQIIAQYGLYDDDQLATYVNEVAQAVLEASAYSDPNTTPPEIRSTPFHFRVLDTPVVNAFALPGGYIYVTRGLLAHLDNEAQLAVVLGHEIGHVLARHASRRAASAQLGQLGLFGAAILGGVLGGGEVAQGILDYGGTGVQLLFLRYGREDEREADRAGVAYAELTGYDAAQAARFFHSLERLSQQEGSGIPSFLSTHPDPAEREQTIPQLAALYDPQGTELDAEDFLDAIDGIILGENPAQGFVEGGRFYHPELRFQFDVPNNWVTTNTPAAVLLQEPNGQAILEFTFAEGSTAREAAQQFANQQGIQIADQRSLTINGNSAYTIRGSANTQSGALTFQCYFVEFNSNVYRLTGLASPSTFNQYASSFNQTATSFEQLTNQRYLNRQASRLSLVRTDRTMPFSEIVRLVTVPLGMTVEELAILNQVELDQPISSGTILKLPG